MSQPVEAIERTPEYEQFMTQLRDFHESKGTPFQPEPILGGKKLDLLRIYKTVLEAGGYEKVTQNRGWKQVGDPFDFPPTCTNSAYILKAVYIKNLLGWEEEHYWKRPWNPPKEPIEPRHVTTHSKAGSPMPIASAIKPRDTARQTATAFNYQAQQPHPHQQQQQQQQPLPPPPNPNFQNMRAQLPPPPGFMPQFPPPAMQSPAMFYPPPIFVDEEFRARLILALKSSLPNEIDWAFNTLVKISFNFDALTLDYMPILLDVLVEFAEPFYREHVEPALEHKVNNSRPIPEQQQHLQISSSMFSNKRNQEMLERVLQVFHILRNFSFLEANVRRIAHHQRLRHMLMMGIALPPDSPFAELSRHCLDILENIAPQVIVNGPADPYILTMFFLLSTNDRALILGAIRSLTRVGVTEVNERVLGTGNPEIIQRMAQLLLVDDEEMAAATLEYFYQCSSLNGNFSTVLVKHYPGNLIGLLTGYLSYKSVLAPKSSSLMATVHGIPQTHAGHIAGGNSNTPSGNTKKKNRPPTIPDLTDYAHLDEPYRCLGWLKEKLAKAGLEDKMELQEVFGRYMDLFGTEKPLGLKEFYTVLKIAFPQPKEVENAVASGQLDTLILQNVKYAPLKPADELKCKWVDCGEQFENEQDLHRHILVTHLVPGAPPAPTQTTTSEASAQPSAQQPQSQQASSSSSPAAQSSEPAQPPTQAPEPAQPSAQAQKAEQTPASSAQPSAQTPTSAPAQAPTSAQPLQPATTSGAENRNNENDKKDYSDKMDIDSTEPVTTAAAATVADQKENEKPFDNDDNVDGYKCRWLNCKRSGFKDKNSAIQHLKTHLVATTGGKGKITKQPTKKRQQQQQQPPFSIDKIPVDDSDVSGVPLTAALLLRNLARDRQHHTFFMPYQSELTSLAIQRPKLARYILTVLGELQA